MSIIQKQSKCLLSILCLFFTANICADATIVLNRVSTPSQEMIDKEKIRFRTRQVACYSMIIATVAGGIGILHLSHQAAMYLKDNGTLGVRVKNLENKVGIGNVAAQGWGAWAKNGAKEFVGDVFSVVPNFVSTVIITGALDTLKNKYGYLFADETVLWYIEHQTKMLPLLSDMKNFAVEYDVYSELLSAESFNQDAKIHLKAFTSELVDSVKDQTIDSQGDAGWFTVLYGSLKKKYAKQGLELEKLQDTITPYLAQKKRAEIEGFSGSSLFSSDVNKRREIADMCNLFAKYAEKVGAFLSMRLGSNSAKVQSFVDMTNEYLTAMEHLLNASSEDLEQASKENKGMFTYTYEYEKLFKDKLSYIHRYCKMFGV